MDKRIPNGYYTYAYISKKTNLPYYIGKGVKNRMYVSHRKHGITTPRDIGQIVVLEEGLTEIGALALERRYIEWYGRKNTKTGILHNKTDGGETPIGHVKTLETIEKHRVQLKGRPCWTNGERSVRSWECPGAGWTRGNAQNGKKWWNDGVSEMWCKECPAGWNRGRLEKMREHLKSIAQDAGIKGSQVRWG
jgi:hypothetical protein